MYGVPADLNLEMFKGATLDQIAISKFQLQFHFEGNAYIGVEGQWQLLSGDGEVMDAGKRELERVESRIQVLLGRRVVAWAVNAPEWFELVFEGDLALR